MKFPIKAANNRFGMKTMNQRHQQSRSPKVVCLGETLIDFIGETPGDLAQVSFFQKCPGGAPANVAVGIARLGGSCGFIGVVGADPFGWFLIKTLQENGVYSEGIVQTTKAPTALAFVSRKDSGERDFLFYRKHCADLLLTKKDLLLPWLETAKYLHVGSVSLSANPSQRTTMFAVKHAKAYDAKITFDPNLRLDLWSNDSRKCRHIIRKLLPLTDIVLPSEEELCFLMETDEVQEAVMRITKLGPTTVCVKQGTAGVTLFQKSPTGDIIKEHQPAFPVTAIDTTGAGDGFNAGFITGLMQGLTPSRALYQGQAVAALVVTKIGAMSALPSRQELTEFLGTLD
jgi:fructokinase